MKTNENFLIGKKDKNLQSLVVFKRNEGTCMRLCIDTPIKYTDRKETVFIETDTEIRVENYSSYSSLSNEKLPINELCFHCSVYNGNHITNFINSIKKDSDVKFKVVAYNGSDALKQLNLVHHSLYGIIDNKEFMLSDYVGHNNTASPVK